MVVLQAQGLTKSIGVKEILTEISFLLHRGEKAGLVGINGAGKTTLLRTLTGEEPADKGTITRAQGIRIGYLAQHFVPDFAGTVLDLMLAEFTHLAVLKEQMTVLEAEMSDPAVCRDKTRLQRTMDRYAEATREYEQSGGYSHESKVRGVLAGLGFAREDYDRDVRDFSGGQRTRLALGRLLLTEPEILLLDEPTNHLDIPTVEWLEGYLRDYPGAVLLVSHDRYFLDRTVTRVLELEAGRLQEFPGNFSRYQVEKARRQAAAEKEFARQQARIARMEAYIERNRAGVNAKQARGRQSQLDRIRRVAAPRRPEPGPNWHPSPKKVSGNTVAFAEKITVGYPGCEPLLAGLAYHVQKGDKIGLVGANGAGKTTLLKTIAGELAPLAGEAGLGSQVTVGYFAQNRQDSLVPGATLIQTVQAVEPINEAQARAFLAGFQFTGDDAYKLAGGLSGGEHARLVLACLLLRGDNFLALDEPTNHLDLTAKTALEEGLSEYEGTILVVSHDRYFLDQTVEKIWELDGGVLREYPGDYSYYRWKKQMEAAQLREADQLQESAQRQATAGRGADRRDGAQREAAKGTGWVKDAGAGKGGPGARGGRSQRNAASAKKLKTAEQLESEINLAEARIAELSDLLAQPDTYREGEGGREYLAEYQKLQAHLEDLYSEWETVI